MMFDSWQAFFAMGGHGLYVWMAYSAAAALLVANLAGLRADRRRAHRQVQGQLRGQLRNSAEEGSDASEAP